MPAHLNVNTSSSVTLECRGGSKTEIELLARQLGSVYFGVASDDELLETAPFNARVVYYGNEGAPALYAAEVRVILRVKESPAARISFSVGSDEDGNDPEDAAEAPEVSRGRFAPVTPIFNSARRAGRKQATDDDSDVDDIDDDEDFEDDDPED